MMPDVNVRDSIIAKLKPLLPPRWNVKPTNALPDAIDQTTVVLTFLRYEKKAMLSPSKETRLATFVLTIITAQTDPARAEDTIDDDAIDLLNALDLASKDTGLVWTTAERGMASGRQGFDIEIAVPIHYQPPVQETP